jgi:hypothetical protein
MNYVLTEHARMRCAKRNIREEWVVAALEHPARTENDLDDPTLAHALRPIPEKGFRVLRVIYNETLDPVIVVTGFFDEEVTDL